MKVHLLDHLCEDLTKFCHLILGAGPYEDFDVVLKRVNRKLLVLNATIMQETSEDIKPALTKVKGDKWRPKLLGIVCSKSKLTSKPGFGFLGFLKVWIRHRRRRVVDNCGNSFW